MLGKPPSYKNTHRHIRRSFFVSLFFILISLFGIIDFFFLFPFADLHTYTCTHICTYKCVHTYTYIHTYIHHAGVLEKTNFRRKRVAPDAMLIAFTFAYILTYVHSCMYYEWYLHTYLHTCTYVHIYVCTMNDVRYVY